MLSSPLFTPGVLGVKRTVTVQVAPGASEAGHLLVWLKSPVVRIATRNSGALPSLLIDIDCGTVGSPTVLIANVIASTDNLLWGANNPVPESWTKSLVCSDSSETANEAVLVPAPTGAKEASTKHTVPEGEHDAAA